MKIPILNIYYLLCYAWNFIDEAETVVLKPETFDGPVDLFAKVLNDGVARLISRGLDRDYLVIQEDLRGIRGKLNLATTIKRNLLLNAKTNCSFDEFSYDIPQNQILKATLRNLTLVDSLNHDQKERSRNLYWRFTGVSNVRLTTKLFRTVRIHRNNRFYLFLMQICRIIHENLLVNEIDGTVQFRDFRKDEARMGALFEKFVKTFCERHTQYKVTSPRIDWFETSGSESDLRYLPNMETDIVLELAKRTIILDTKFYSSPITTNQYGKKRIKSDNLYQIFSYVTNWSLEHGKEDLEGWLLYAAVDDTFDYHYKIGGQTIRVCSIDLSQNWRKIEEDLLSIVDHKLRNDTVPNNLNANSPELIVS
ncbi:MAG: 5-methylcytosine-specific restriction endonuclease system specificity protein McrC [Bacteroidetes bacterium]|nr:5-methylcytosine-specific restriction endonuclease system specificity protein McrC [Bacteroidota bacterium]MCY4206314.1 5-methylcytosine-specific restriction endonuclease system specificity protein McrC [Bacteroidota bacterium]